MRTKTLLLAAAAALAAGILSSSAQVYSANVVGYVNIPLANGYTLIANQMDYDGTGTNNNVNTVFGTNLVAGTIVFAWSPSLGSFNNASWINSKGTLKWSGDTNDVNIGLNAGQGVFVQSPATNTITVVGTVIQGTNVTGLTPGYNLVSSTAPRAGGLQGDLGYSPLAGDIVFFWDPVGQAYSQTFSYVNSKVSLKWTPSQPTNSVGQAVFIQTANTAWTNTFTVQ
jgi:hypothetical protein